MERCSLCNLIFPSREDFKVHMLGHISNTGTNVEVCTLCGEEFPSCESLQHHVEKHIENDQAEKCLYCGGMFTSREYKTHIKIHMTDPSCEKCSICEVLLPPEELKVHLRQHVEENDSAVETCTVCNGQYPSNELKHHIMSHELENQNVAKASSGHNMQVKGTLRPVTYRILEKCKICNQLFESKTDLKVHMKVHEVERPQTPAIITQALASGKSSKAETGEKCSICGSVFASEEEFKTHVKSHTDGNGLVVWKCDTCDQTFYTQGAFKNHMHDPISSYLQCLVCKKTFSETKHFELHQRIHYLEKQLKSKYKVPAEERPFVCSICNKSFALQKQLDAHKRIHVLEKKFFKCTVCGLKFTQPDILKSHLETHVVANFFVCKVCEKTFPRADLLLQHVKTHDDLKKCKHCGQMVVDLEAHVKQHHSPESFICGLCGVKFTECWKLEIHMKYHAQSEPKKCDLCPTGFTSETELSHHLSTHREQELPDLKVPIVKQKCYICSKIFISDGDLTNHLEAHRNDDGVYECKVCKMIFRSLCHLQDHMRSHSDDKPFTCKVCGRYYKYHNSLLYHERTHKGEGPFVCKYCPKRFYRFSELYKHTRNMHPGVKIKNEKGRAKSVSSANVLKRKTYRDQKNPYMDSLSKPKKYKSRESKVFFLCSLCDESFSNVQILNYHMRRNHDLFRRNSHKCLICKKLFSSLLSLKFHVGRLHKSQLRKKNLRVRKQVTKKGGNVLRQAPATAAQDAEFSFACGVCGKSFFGCDELTEHIELSHMVSE